MSANLSGSSSLNLANGHSELNPGSCSSVYSPASPTSSLPGNQGDGNGLIDVEVNGEEEEGLDFVYSGHHAELLESMGNLRRQNHFCDAVLRVGEREVLVQRAVLAASSPFLFDLFSRSADTHHGSTMYKLRDVSFTGFSHLLDFMYSGRLRVAANEVSEVYRTAKLLRMGQAAQACSAFLAGRLTPSNCLGVRLCAEDSSFRAIVDEYIQKNIEKVIKKKQFFGLPDFRVEVIGAEEALERGGSERQLFNLVLEWAQKNIDESKLKVEVLTEELSVLYLNSGNRLLDCKDVDDSAISDDDVVKDYKKHSHRRTFLSSKNHDIGENYIISNGTKQLVFHKFNISPERGQPEKEWSVVAILKQSESSFAGIAVLAGKMMAITLHLRQAAIANLPHPYPNVVSAAIESREVCPTLVPLESMASSRCAFGVCLWNDSIVVCGGYDRGECLVTSESYNLRDGHWSQLPKMPKPRARFGAALLRGRLYTIGGSDGTKDLKSVNYFDFASQRWKQAASLNKERSYVGVAELNEHLYCVGGSEGQKSLNTCEVYDVDKDEWCFIASLNTARYQAAVSAFVGGLVAVGGTDAWNCLSSVEIYNPQTDTWTLTAPLGTPRRGAGIDVVDNKLWVVGGSDGVSSLRSTEICDSDLNSWTFGPALNMPRANVSAVSTNGSLYAIGGFSGKKFLNTIEVLAHGRSEWCAFLPSRRNSKHLPHLVEAAKDLAGENQHSGDSCNDNILS